MTRPVTTNPAEGDWVLPDAPITRTTPIAKQPRRTGENIGAQHTTEAPPPPPIEPPNHDHRIANGEQRTANSEQRNPKRAAADTDPTLRVYDLMALERIDDSDIATGRFFITVIGLVAAVALLLATAGIYALTSFAVARRTREIGIRTALGAAPRRIVTALFSRTFGQVGIGVLIGSIPGGVLLSLGLAETVGSDFRIAIAGTACSALIVLVVAVLTCLVPARRALRIQPTEALRVDA